MSAPPSATSSAWASSRSRCPISPAPPPMPRTPSPPPASRRRRRARPSVTASPPARSSARTPPRAPRSTSAPPSATSSAWASRPWPCPISRAPPPMPRTTLADAGLTVGDVERPTATTSPPARSSARTRPPAPRSTLGSTVSYVVSLGVETVAVPDLSGAAADADDKITAAGLTVGDVRSDYSDSVAIDEVDRMVMLLCLTYFIISVLLGFVAMNQQFEAYCHHGRTRRRNC